MSTTAQPEDALGIAIVGFAARFPGAPDIDQFWQNLRNGVESVAFFTDEELIAAGVDPAEMSRPEYVRAKGYLPDAELFDAGFFGFTPREAVVMDPQQRIFLECSWEALENAGYNPQARENFTAIFASSSVNSYLLRYWTSEAYQTLDPMQLTISSDKDFMATRVAYKLNLRGPAITVQTACSSSLAAVSQACQSLCNYQCDMALAGGVSVKNPRVGGYLYQPGAILSPDGHCRPFDAKSAGTVTGEGVAVVVLKRLDDAIADGDTIHAVIKGFALNNDGSNKVGYTAPSVDGQAEVIVMAQAFAGVEPDSISYIEAHGTGTDLGDPIEVAALTQAFRNSTQRRQFCGIGSVKSNFGHTDAAAGVTGLIKTVLALEHREIPPSLHFEKPNPLIDFENSPFYVVNRLIPWDCGNEPRRAGVSAFGIGGTNVHVVLEEAPDVPEAGASSPHKLVVLSARSESALNTSIERLSAHLRARPSQDLADVAYTLQAGRKGFDWRAVAVCRDGADALAALGTAAGTRLHRGHVRGHERPVAFGFTGQGSQYPGMGAGLYRDEAAYREAADECFYILKARAALDLAPVLYPQGRDAKQAEERLRDTRYAQPALFVTEYALARLWISWGVQPEVMIGHSIGEYVAACLAGVMTLADALTLVAHRGRLMGALEGGSMLAVPLEERDVAPLLGARLALAAVNAPGLCVISGENAAIDALESQMRARRLDPVRLHTSHAFHSHMMDPALEEFGRCVAQVPLAAPRIPYVSNLTGDWITAEEATDPGYWVRHLREPVRFSAGVQRLMADEARVFLEVGPGGTLAGLARKQLGVQAQDRVFGSLRSPRLIVDDVAHLLETLGRLWLTGSEIDWQAFRGTERRLRVPLPTYPFERKRHWIEPTQSELSRAVPGVLRKKADIADWFYVPSWRQTPSAIDVIAQAPAAAVSWLIFADELGFGEALAKRLARGGDRVQIVRAGESFEKRGDGSFIISPAADFDYERLFASLSEVGPIPDRVVHLWGVTDDSAKTPADREMLLERCFWSPTCLARSLGRVVRNPTEVTFVANGLQRVTGNETICPEKATALGPCRVASQEYPDLACRSIDMMFAQARTPHADLLVAQLEAELRAAFTGAPVAYRGLYRWVRDHEAVRIPPSQTAPTRLRRNGVYLVTGGLGGIGLAIAGDLARSVAARLVLVGRSEFPAPELWDQWLATHGPGDKTSVRIGEVRALEALGAQVLVASADVADAEQMRAVVAKARGRFGAIHGVIHSAGVPAGGIIELKTRESAAAILAPKVQGTRVLDEIFRGDALDFFALCSSLTATLGSVGQVDYVAANAFLDAFAQSRGGLPGLTVAIQWDAWSETGMAVDTNVPAGLAAIRRQGLETGLSTAEGVEAFRRALCCSLPQVIVSTCDLGQRMDPEPVIAPAVVVDVPERISASEQSQVPALSSSYVAPRTEIERAVAAIWQELFGIDCMGIHDNFIEADGHSLLAIQIVARIGKDLGVKLPVNAIFEYPTIAEIAGQIEAAGRRAADQDKIVAEMLQMVEQLSDDEVSKMLAEKSGQT